MPRNALTPPGVFEPDPGNALAGAPSLADAWDVNGPALRRNAADTWQAVQNPQTWMDAGLAGLMAGGGAAAAGQTPQQ